MPAAMGARQCPVVGCARRVHVTPGGTVWARCIAHGLGLLHGAFTTAIQQGARAAAASPGLNGPGSLLTGELSVTAGTRTG